MRLDQRAPSRLRLPLRSPEREPRTEVLLEQQIPALDEGREETHSSRRTGVTLWILALRKLDQNIVISGDLLYP